MRNKIYGVVQIRFTLLWVATADLSKERITDTNFIIRSLLVSVVAS